ncbi:bacterial Ig-like domain-containing protein [Segatella paludivivens]|uniref:bacterial Ig-like domain-containing protein n=1 Tax=Segatella paludivivens TaxID=185294 RepID=UPI0003702F6B|nr:bacterial Ig-like domain-containing protein [Segatella paludivivens]
MKHLNKIASIFCGAAFGLLALASCEGGDVYNVNAPDWISHKIDSIENSKKSNEEVLVGMQEDVYTIGNSDYSSGWWSSFSKYYVVPDGQKWNAVLNLNLNSGDNTYYKNFAIVFTNDVDRGGTGYQEYGSFRFDATGDSAKYNSQWGNHLYFKYTNSTQLLAPDANNKDANVQKLGGKVTITVDRTSSNAFKIKITNGTVTKTYDQPFKLSNLNADPSDTNIRCFLVPEGSYIDFLQTNIVPIGGLTSAQDKAPVSMVLQNVPDEVTRGTTLDKAMSNISAEVTYEEGVKKVIPASELYISAIPDMDVPGEKNLVVIYNKTFKGSNATKPIVAYAKFNVVNSISSIKITKAPSRSNYYFFNSAATSGMTDRTLAFDPTGMEVTATYADGSSAVIDNAKLKFSSVPASAGTYNVTVSTANGKTDNVSVTVSESSSTFVTPNPTALGAADNTGAWWSVFTDNIKVPAGKTYAVSFTNYSSMAGNWNNFVTILRNSANSEYAVVRSDNYGWGNGYAASRNSGGQANWPSWLAAMNGANVNLYVTNCNNGTADVQAVMKGTDGKTYIQYYLGVNTVDVNDLCFAFTIDSCHLVFKSSLAAGKRSSYRK